MALDLQGILIDMFMSLIFQTHGADAIENLWEFHPKISSNHGISTPDSRHEFSRGVVGPTYETYRPKDIFVWFPNP